MLKRSSSSSSSLSADCRKFPPAPPSQAVFGRNKKLVDARNPLQDLNGVGSSCYSSNASCSSSIEAPRGCLRFFLSHSSSSNRNRPPERSAAVSDTPKSAPAPKLRKKPNPSKRKSAKEFTAGFKFKSCSVSGEERPEGSKEMQTHELGQVHLCGDSTASSTPIAKISSGLGGELSSAVNKVLEEKSNDTKIKTPPLQPSVSPETQCVLNVMSVAEIKPPCYGAGHLLSGIPDRRKCRPRGVLCVRGNSSKLELGADGFGSVDEETDVVVDKRSGVSPVLLPHEASVHWFSSPCKEVRDEEKKTDHNGFYPVNKFEDSPSLCFSSPVSPTSLTFSTDIGKKSNVSCATNSTMDTSSTSRRSSGLTSARRLSSVYRDCDNSPPIQMTPTSLAFPPKERRKCSYDIDREDAPSSIGSLLSSGNVIQTPSSDTVGDRYGGLCISGLFSENTEKDPGISKVDAMSHIYDKAVFSPEHQLSTWDPADFSFRLDYLDTPCNSIDLAKFQKVLDNKESWISDSTTSAFLSQSPLRISWRDGLVSRIFDMDRDDLCRCFSDDEEDPFVSSKQPLADIELLHSPELSRKVRSDSCFSKVSGARSTEPADKKSEADVKELHPHVIFAPMESMSFDGDRLIESSDSDWNLCYSNKLFQV